MDTLLLAMIVVVLGILYVKRSRGPKFKTPPGPPTYPLIGSAYALMSNPAHLHVTLTNLAKIYGPLYQLKMLQKRLIVISDPEMIKEALNGANPPVLLRFVSNTMYMLDRGESLTFATTRDHWTVLRKAISPLIKNMPGGIPILQVVTEEMEHLFDHIDKNITKELYLNPLLMHYTRNVFLRILQRKGWPYENMPQENVKFFENLFKALQVRVSILDYVPSLDFIRSFSRKQTVEVFDVVHTFIQKMIDDRKAEGYDSATKGARDFLDMLIQEMNENPEVSNHDLVTTLRSLFTAATGTVSDTLDWMLLFLCGNPLIQQKCYEEIKEKIGDRQPTMEDQPNLTYLDCVIKETFRLRPPAPLGVTRVAERDCTIGGYHVPKDTLIVQNLYGIGNMESQYENHEQFDPERWLRNPELSSKLLHFSTGPTMCLGLPVARQELFLTATRLIQKYKFTISPYSPVPDFNGEFKVVFNPTKWLTAVSLREWTIPANSI